MPLGNIGNASGMLGDAIDDLTGAPSESRTQGGKRDGFDASRFTNWKATDLEEGVWNDLAEYIVEPQTRYRPGYGSAPIEETVGRWFMHFLDGSGNEVTGFVRVQTRDSNDENVDTVVSRINTNDLSPDGANRPSKRDMYAQPETTGEDRVGEDSKIVIQFMPDTSGPVDQDASEIQMQNTRYSRERSQ